MLYRIITEDKNRDGIVDIVKEYFDGFTLIPAIGYWQGIKENSLIIEIDVKHPLSKYRIKVIAKRIKELNEQQAVIVQQINVKSELI